LHDNNPKQFRDRENCCYQRSSFCPVIVDKPHHAELSGFRGSANGHVISRSAWPGPQSFCCNSSSVWGDEQLEWLEKDVKGLSASTPIVLMAHLPLWTIYEPWGWGTADAGRALGYVKRFGSVDRPQRAHPPDHPEGRGQRHLPYRGFDGISAAGAGHRSRSWADEGRAGRGVAQVPRHTDGQLHPRQGRSRADRQHARCLKGRTMLTPINPALRRRRITLLLGAVGLTALLAAALPELTAAGAAAVTVAASPATVDIDNFAFAPAALTVTAGTTVTWKNEDDSPHRIGDKNGTFKSAALDTDDTFSHTFAAPGEYPYICTIHP
jgi:plastocyanin